MTMLSQHFDAPIAERLDAILRTPNALWVTDADGTLWRDDIGEGFLRQLITDDALVSPEAQGVDVWQSYEERVAQDKLTGYAWAVQVMEQMESNILIRPLTLYAGPEPRSYVPIDKR